MNNDSFKHNLDQIALTEKAGRENVQKAYKEKQQSNLFREDLLKKARLEAENEIKDYTLRLQEEISSERFKVNAS